MIFNGFIFIQGMHMMDLGSRVEKEGYGLKPIAYVNYTLKTNGTTSISKMI